MSLEAIAGIIRAELPGLTGGISGWSIDSRTIARGDCFFALRGPTHDGHDFVASVFERGAALAIVEETSDAGGLQLLVSDTTAALQALGRGARQMWGGTVVG